MYYIGPHKHYAKLPAQNATPRLTALSSSIGSTAVQSDSGLSVGQTVLPVQSLRDYIS